MALGLFEQARMKVRTLNEPVEEMRDFSRVIRQMARDDGRPVSELVEDAVFIRRASKWMVRETAHFWTREGAIGFVLSTLAQCA